jgi:aminopeptidase N
VLHQLRAELGDNLFRAGIRHWTKSFADKPVTSEQFRAAMEHVAGRSLRWFWDQWVYGAGFPQLGVQVEWDAGTKELVWRVQQHQPVRGNVGRFRFPVVCEATAGGTTWRERIEIHAAQTEWRVPMAERPSRVRFNRHGWLAATIDVDMETEWWVNNLNFADDDVCARLDSVAHLRAAHTGTLAGAAVRDAHWAVREDAVKRLQALWGKLSNQHREIARGALINAAGDEDSRVRRAACAALGVAGRDQEVERLLLSRLRSDPKEFVKAAACEGLSAIGGDAAVGGLREALTIDSYRDEVRIQAVHGLAKHRAKGAAGAIRPFIAYAWGKGGQHRLRQAALDRWVELAGGAAGDAAVNDLLIKLTADPYHRMRGKAIGHLRTRKVNTPAARAALQRVARTDHVGGNRTAARAALEALTGGGAAPARDAGDGPAKRVAELLREAERLKIEAERLLLEAKRLELEAREAKLGK